MPQGHVFLVTDRLVLVYCEANVVFFTGFISNILSTGSDFVVPRINWSLSKSVFALRKLLSSYGNVSKPTLTLRRLMSYIYIYIYIWSTHS